MTRLHDGEVSVGVEEARQLVASQFPEWADRSVRPLSGNGTQHHVFRLGDELVLRFPRIGPAQDHVAKEWGWLGHLADALPVAVPLPVAVGAPAHGYPFIWSVSRWVDGEDLVGAAPRPDDPALGTALARIVGALGAVDPGGAPPAGKRGQDLAPHDATTRGAIALLPAELRGSATRAWEDGLAADPWAGPPRWVHGDLIKSNVLVRDGSLTGVIDWASAGVGDPACDLMIAWGLPARARSAFVDAVDADDATWCRARAWVVEQAAAFLPYYGAALPGPTAVMRHRLHTALTT